MSIGTIGLFGVREAIIARSRGDDELEEIDLDLIVPAPVVVDEKAALWLLAWCTNGKA